MEITEYIIKKINDPTGIIAGERFEYRLYIDLGRRRRALF